MERLDFDSGSIRFMRLQIILCMFVVSPEVRGIRGYQNHRKVMRSTDDNPTFVKNDTEVAKRDG